jgi:hypothetical protein
LPVTPNVVPIVVELLTVNPFTVALLVALIIVKLPVLAVTLPIGVFCMPPDTVKVVSVPTLVMLGCAFPETVTATEVKSLTFAQVLDPSTLLNNT